MTRWVRADEVLWRDNLDQVVLLPLDSTEPVLLSPTGAVLWDLLATPTATDALVAELAEFFDGDPGEVERGVGAVLADLEERKAVRCLT
jgi:hypothetical protein